MATRKRMPWKLEIYELVPVLRRLAFKGKTWSYFLAPSGELIPVAHSHAVAAKEALKVIGQHEGIDQLTALEIVLNSGVARVMSNLNWEIAVDVRTELTDEQKRVIASKAREVGALSISATTGIGGPGLNRPSFSNVYRNLTSFAQVWADLQAFFDSARVG